MRALRLNNRAGFSLVELMIVVAIIGVLAALAVPRFQVFQAKSKQSEAKTNLSHVYTLQQSYFGDNDFFGTTTQIGFTIDGMARYGYAEMTATGIPADSMFLTIATATLASTIRADCGMQDVWQIDELKALAVTYDCANPAN